MGPPHIKDGLYDHASKSDEFLEKSQTALDSPPIFGKLCCIGQIVSVNIINNNTKHTLNPEITLLFINFMLKKPCLKIW